MIKFAIIGCGKVAERHAEHIFSKGKLLAVCDVVKDKADRMAQKYAANAYYAIEDLLQQESDTDIVAVCTPNGLHAEHSIKCLKNIYIVYQTYAYSCLIQFECNC